MYSRFMQLPHELDFFQKPLYFYILRLQNT